MMDDKEKLFGDKKIPLGALLKRCAIYFKDIKWSIFVSLFVVLINVGLDVVLPLIMEEFVDTLNIIKVGTPASIINSIIIFAIAYFAITLINQGFRFIETFLLQRAGNTVVYNLRTETFEHIEKMSLDQFEIMPVGSLVTRVCNYTAQMSDLFTNQIVSLIRNLVTIAAVFGIMVSISWRLSLIILGFAVVVLVLSIVFRNKVSVLFRKEKGYISDLNTALSENFSGMKIIQLFSQEKMIRDEFYVKNKRMRDARYQIFLFFTVYRPLLQFLLYAAISCAFFFGATFALTAGEILAFYLYISKFFEPVQQISDQLVHIERAITSSERLFNLLDVQPKVVDKKNALQISQFKGKIEFKNVWFAYVKENWVLKNVSFTVNAGETCAFVGATGAGKTTIFSLLTKAYVPQKGEILIDGININDISLNSLRNAIGQMLQDVFLFSGNIKDNITLFDEDYTDNEINEAAKYVNADYFISKLDNGIHEEVVERGDNFSQGQRQLLSFARTILHKPQILLLDEATANIDTETEVLIQDSLNKMSTLGTMLVVAHRLSTIKNSDQIICLQNGEVVERGTHTQLLKNKGYYYKLNILQDR